MEEIKIAAKTVDDLGRIVLPQEQCNKLKFAAKDSMRITVENGCILLEKAAGPQGKDEEYFIRKIDDLYRIVLPGAYRKLLNIEKGDMLYSRIDGARIMLSKMREKSACRICGATDNLIVLSKTQCACRNCVLQALSSIMPATCDAIDEKAYMDEFSERELL